MSVYDKLNEARIRFQNSNVRKSGKNKFAGYDYFELQDILPVCNRICYDIKAVCVVSFNGELATLDFIDNETNEKITFSSPMSNASLKGCHEVQNLGAVESYIKRYLYQNCFEISEGDSLDSTMNPTEKPAPKQYTHDVSEKPAHKQSEQNISEKMNTVLDIINSGKLQGSWVDQADMIYKNKDEKRADGLIAWYKRTFENGQQEE